MSQLNLVIIFCIVMLLLADRFLLARGSIKVESVRFHDTHNGYHRLSLSFKATLPLRFTQISYELVDTNDPKTVLSGKARALDFSSHGGNNELLLIKSSLIGDHKDWKVNVKIVSAGSRLNPFYKIYPFVSTLHQSIKF